MSKKEMLFVCQACGTTASKWKGRCEGCGVWNTLVEDVVKKRSPSTQITEPQLLHTLAYAQEGDHRFVSGYGEFDRVCGGGIVPGSVVLLGGDPGIGKSTLLLQIAARVAKERPVLYVSGEEGAAQIYDRARRLGYGEAPLFLLTTTSLSEALDGVRKTRPQLVIIDSIQTLHDDSVDSLPGSLTQVRSCAQALLHYAKKSDTAMILVGHMTKDGMLAGPKVLEHMVDTVLSFEGDRHYDHRMLRTVKNRFGPTREMGLFTMTSLGLDEVTNPSELFLTPHAQGLSGTAVLAGLEGSRPLLCEVQALVSAASFGTPRRVTVGADAQRLSMILAVLESRCGYPLGGRDVYLNVVGGLRITEPAADLAMAAALISAFHQEPLPPHSVFFGEIGLGGEIRPVSDPLPRLKEAEKLGFSQAFFPENGQILENVSLKFYPLKGVKDLSTLKCV